MHRQILHVNGMHCGSCGMLIDEALEELPGVVASKTSVRRGRTKVDYDPDVTGPNRFVKAIEKLGYQAELLGG